MTATAIAPKMTREQKARLLGKQGYTLSESLVTVGVYFVGRPNGEDPYIVDVAGGTCTCMDFCQHGAPCKHQIFISLCCRWWKVLEARAAKAVRSRRRFSMAHLAAFRAMAPTFAAPAPVQPTEPRRSRWTAEEYANRMSEDFG
jgi:hypothetical protein